MSGHDDEESAESAAWIARQRAEHGPWRCDGCGAEVAEVNAVYGTYLRADCACLGRTASRGGTRGRTTYPRAPSAPAPSAPAPSAPAPDPDREALGRRVRELRIELSRRPCANCDGTGQKHWCVCRDCNGTGRAAPPVPPWSDVSIDERNREIDRVIGETIAREAAAAERAACVEVAEGYEAAVDRGDDYGVGRAAVAADIGLAIRRRGRAPR